MLLILCTFSPIAHLHPVHPIPSYNTPFSSGPRAMHISSLAAPFSILFLTSACLFCTYQLRFLIPIPFPPFSPFLLSADNPRNDLQIYDSVSVVVVCLVCWGFFRFSVDGCEFVAILMFIVLIFFLNKSL